MSLQRKQRQRLTSYPVVGSRLAADEIRVIDSAAALRGESRASYIARVALREARADLREAERKQEQQQAVA